MLMGSLGKKRLKVRRKLTRSLEARSCRLAAGCQRGALRLVNGSGCGLERTHRKRGRLGGEWLKLQVSF